MERFRKKLTAFVIVLAASMTLMSLPVMAKTNSKPAQITKPVFVFVDEEGEPTGTQVKSNKLTLVKGTDQEEVTIKADATLKNALPSDQLVVKAETATGVEITPSENNVFTIKGVSAIKNSVVKFTYTVSNNATKNKQKSAPDIASATPKTVKLKVKVVEDAATVELEGDKMNISDNGVTAEPVEYVGEDDFLVGTSHRWIKVYEIDTTGAKSTRNSKDVYTIPVTIPVAVSGNDSKTKFAYTTTNSNAATFSGKLKSGKLTGTIKVKRDAFTGEDGLATAVIGVGVKSTEVPFGGAKVYGKSDYIKLIIKPNALGKKIKLTGASPVVEGKKTKKAAFVIPAGESQIERTISAAYNSNGGKVSVAWDEVQDESKGYTITNNNDNTATLTVLKPFKASDKIELTGKVTSLDEEDKEVKSANLKLKITATKKVDKVAEDIKSKGSGKKGIGDADGSTYYGTNMRTMWINGNREKVRTFYYLAPTKNFAESFSVEALPNDDYKEGVAQGAITNTKLVAVKDVSDSEKNNKSTISVKQDKGKKTFTATLNVKKPSAKSPLTDEELVIYQIAAADSKNATTGQYGVGRYVAISVNPKQVDKDVEIKINGSTSGNKIVPKGDAVEITVSANKDVPYTVESRNEDVVVVQVDENKYQVYGANTGDTYVDAKIAGVKEPKASLHVYVVGFDDLKDATMYPGDRDVTLGKVGVNIEGATAVVSVNAIGNDEGYISISGNKTLKNGESTTISVVSANKAKDKRSDAVVKVEATATFTVSGMNPISVNKVATVTVKPYTVEFDKTAYVIDTADTAIKPVITVKGAKTVENPDYALSANRASASYAEDFVKVLSDNSISGNSAGVGTLKATYKDVNGNEYDTTAQITVTDKGGTKTYKDETVVSFNAVQKVEAGINGVDVTTQGGTETIKNAYKRFMNNARKIPDDAGRIEFTITLSGNGIKPVSANESAGEAEEPAAEAEEPAAEVEKPAAEEPAAEAEEPAAEVSENAAEEAAQISAETEEAVSANETAEEPAAEAEEPAAEEPAAEAEEPAAEAEEPAAEAEEPAAEAEEPAAETEEPAAEAEEEAATAATQQVIKVTVEKGVVTSTPSENSVLEFIEKNFDGTDNITMTVTFEANKTIPNLLGIANQVLEDRTESFSKTITIHFTDNTNIELKDVHFENGLYCIGTQDTFGIKGTGDKTVVIYKGTLKGKGSAGEDLVKKLTKVGNLIAGVEYYGNDGKSTGLISW